MSEAPLEFTMPRDPVNLGAHTLRKTILDFLSDRMPKYLDLVRAEYPQFDETHLPSIAYFDAYDPYTAKDYPCIGAYINGSDEPQWDDINFTGGQTFTSAYDVTLFVATRTALLGTDEAGVILWEQPERDSAMRIRDIYLGAMKAVIFNEPTFGTASIEIGHTRLVRKTYKEMMGEPWSSGSPAYIASGIVSANIEHTESTSPVVYGYVNNIDTEVTLVNDIESIAVE